MIKQSPRLTRTALTLTLALVAVGALLPVKQAAAFTPPPCETTECPSAGPKAWAGVTKAVIAALVVLEEDIYLNVLYVKDAITRLANQHSNNRQNLLKSLTGINDKELAGQSGFQIGSSRANIVGIALPSRTACGAEARRAAVLTASTSTRAAVGPAETAATAIFTNAPSTPGARGQLSFTSDRFQNRMSKYCDSTTVQAPSGITCAASIGANRDLFPYDSLFKQGTFASANDYTAAKDVVLNLLGDAVKDPVRGNALSRVEGQNASLRLYSDQAQMNLASSIMLAMVERRRNISGSGSEVTKQREASYTDAAIEKLAEINAGQTDSQNIDTVFAMLNEGTRSIFMLRDYMEQWAALKAVSLAIDVKQGATPNAGVSARPIGN